MRVISGEYGGRKLVALTGENTRPTTDKVKESIFNIIGPYFEGGIVLDLYAGSGGLAIEAVSRGMDKAICIEKNNAAINIIKKNIEITKEPDKFEVKKMDANKALEYLQEVNLTFDLVLLDPPYARQQIELQLDKMVTRNLLNDHATIVCETDKSVTLNPRSTNFEIIREVTYGMTKITILRMEETNE